MSNGGSGLSKNPRLTGRALGACPTLWSHQESNLDLEFRKLLFYPLNYETNIYEVAKLINHMSCGNGLVYFMRSYND
jgi:hypothetical protein